MSTLDEQAQATIQCVWLGVALLALAWTLHPLHTTHTPPMFFPSDRPDTSDVYSYGWPMVWLEGRHTWNNATKIETPADL